MFKEYVHPTPPDWAGGACGCGGASLSVGVGEAAKLYIFSCNKKCGILNVPFKKYLSLFLNTY